MKVISSALLLLVLVPTVLAGGGKPMKKRMGGKKKKFPKNKNSANDATCSVGLVQVESTRSFEDTYNLLITTLNDTDNVFIAKEFDAVKVAGMAGVTGLPANRVVIFGNPSLGTPLMQADQASALDLPQKMHVYETADGKVFVGYNTPKYFEQRYKSINVKSNRILRSLRESLRNLAASVAGVDPSKVNDYVMSSGKNLFHRKSRIDLLVQPSKVDFNTTYSRLVEAIPKNDFILVTTVDHQALAAAKGLELEPTTLIMICRPAFDATMMQANQCAVADFPLKLLVTENADGLVEVRMNNFQFLRQRHHILADTINEEVFDGVHKSVAHIIALATA